MAKVINFNQLPMRIKSEQKKIKRAAAKTLNTIAFDAIPEVNKQASRDMKFSGNVRKAMAFQVEQAKLSDKRPEAAIWTNRGWLFHHLNKGTRKASTGWRWNGRDYIMVPIEPKAFKTGKRLRAAYRKGLYVIPDGRDAFIFYRPRRSSRNSELIAVLKPKVAHNEDTKPDEVLRKVFKKKATRLFRFHLKRGR